MLEELVRLLEDEGVSYCVVGGQAVNAYVEPLVSLDLDMVIVASDLQRIQPLLRERFQVAVFEHSTNLSLPGVSAEGSDPDRSIARIVEGAPGPPGTDSLRRCSAA